MPFRIRPPATCRGAPWPGGGDARRLLCAALREPSAAAAPTPAQAVLAYRPLTQ